MAESPSANRSQPTYLPTYLPTYQPPPTPPTPCPTAYLTSKSVDPLHPSIHSNQKPHPTARRPLSNTSHLSHHITSYPIIPSTPPRTSYPPPTTSPENPKREAQKKKEKSQPRGSSNKAQRRGGYGDLSLLFALAGTGNGSGKQEVGNRRLPALLWRIPFSCGRCGGCVYICMYVCMYTWRFLGSAVIVLNALALDLEYMGCVCMYIGGHDSRTRCTTR